ncbi:hypothetical protein F8M41_002989 [Gigaspora margarita]|uniref:Uncharacterized protein n=1 Tax=Gigaspora margarita TaxID=4874 RepID=A0A8H4A6K2_GIGMA|nr:hypothetical protein F8M41_002989 [Gigaspora margarita]
MDFFKTDDEWTCEDAIKYYQENNHMLDLKQILDKINKDLKEISKFDHVATRREKAEFIICNWKKWTKNAKENSKMQDLIAEPQQQNEIIKTSVVHDQVVQTALSKQLESERAQTSNDLERFKDKNYEIFTSFLPKKRAHNTMQEIEKNITEEDLINSVNDAFNTFGKVEFPSFYSKLKTTWDNQDITNYYVIDLDEENKENIHYDTVVDEVAEISFLDKNDEEMKYTGDDENFNKSIAKLKEIMDQLDDLSEKYHYLSNTFPIAAQHYDQLQMPDMFIVKSISNHLGTIIKMNGAMKNVPERTWTAHRSISTKIDVQENNFKADSVLELFERPMQIPLFLLEVSEGPNNPDPDKINEDRRFGDNIEIGQIIFVGPGVYLFSPFTIPPLIIPTSADTLEHTPRLI